MKNKKIEEKHNNKNELNEKEKIKQEEKSWEIKVERLSINSCFSDTFWIFL